MLNRFRRDSQYNFIQCSKALEIIVMLKLFVTIPRISGCVYLTAFEYGMEGPASN